MLQSGSKLPKMGAKRKKKTTHFKSQTIYEIFVPLFCVNYTTSKYGDTELNFN
jgi:hypothetical protein